MQIAPKAVGGENGDPQAPKPQQLSSAAVGAVEKNVAASGGTRGLVDARSKEIMELPTLRAVSKVEEEVVNCVNIFITPLKGTAAAGVCFDETLTAEAVDAKVMAAHQLLEKAFVDKDTGVCYETVVPLGAAGLKAVQSRDYRNKRTGTLQLRIARALEEYARKRLANDWAVVTAGQEYDYEIVVPTKLFPGAVVQQIRVQMTKHRFSTLHSPT